MEFHEEFFDNLLLDAEEIKCYSYEKCREEVEKKIKKQIFFLLYNFEIVAISKIVEICYNLIRRQVDT